MLTWKFYIFHVTIWWKRTLELDLTWRPEPTVRGSLRKGGLRGWEGCTPGAGCRPGPGPGLHPPPHRATSPTHTTYSHKQSNPFPRNTRTLWPPWHRQERRSQEPRMTVNVSRKVLTRLVIQEYTRISNALRWLYLLECSNCESVWLDKMRIVNECYKT